MPVSNQGHYRQAVAVLWQNGILASFAGLILALLAALATGGLMASPAGAETLPSAPQARATHIAAELVAEKAARPGETILLAIHMSPAPGWHGYWSNPGDAGFGMRLKWTAAPGLRMGNPLYPVPETLLVGGLMNHVFQHDYAVLVPLTLPRALHAGDVLPIAVAADWLACTEQVCVPESAVPHTDIRIAAPGVAQAAQAPDPRFDAWRARLPAPLDAEAHFAVSGKTLRLAIPFPRGGKLERPHLFLAQDRVVDYAAPQGFARKGDLLLITLRRAAMAPVSPTNLAAVLRLDGAGDGLSLSAAPGPVPMGGIPIAADTGGAPASSPASLPLLLLAALAGGLLLNIMPCVFPILSLKALSLARAGESEADARAEGLAYSAGVILACASLGAVLLALRAGGEQVGWAFQLQEPGVVTGLLLLAVAITANLLGLYEFAVPGFALRGAGASRNAFATGLLAAFAATPCTGPFMASAMGAALLLPVLPAMLLFAALGLGIALPFLAIAYVPPLRRLLPRPGAWMVWFRKIMAVPMALTALGLAWLASRLAGWHFAEAAMGLAAALLLLLAYVGQKQRKGLAAARPMLAGLVAMGAAMFALLPQLEQAPDAEAPDILPSRPFTQTRLSDALASGHPVFAYFTADWCLSCKVNEKIAIEREDTRDAFARAGVVVLKGDWTRRDPDITRYLTARGAAGVPLYVWYPSGGAHVGEEPQVLPQVLSPETLPVLAREAVAAR